MPNEGSYEAAKRRSDEVHADLLVHPENYTMLTGDRPTGRLHLGHYFGTHRRAREAAGHGRDAPASSSPTTRSSPTATPPSTSATTCYNMVIDYLACGIDPAKTIIFTHSAVPALNQLMLPFLSLVTEAEL